MTLLRYINLREREETKTKYSAHKCSLSENYLPLNNKAEDWKLFDATLDIKRIFNRIHKEWETKCLAEKLPCHTKQPSIFPDIHFKSGALYSSLFEAFFENYIALILQDYERENNFVKSEFVMVINCMHGSVEYLNKMFKIDDTSIFFQLLKEENQNSSSNKFQSKLQDSEYLLFA